MQIKTKAIVLSSLKFQDKSLIVKCFTASDGLKTYFVRDAFSVKKQNKITRITQISRILLLLISLLLFVAIREIRV